MNIMVSEGATEVELGGMELDWKAVARVQPCWVNRFRTEACGTGWSENLGGEWGEGTLILLCIIQMTPTKIVNELRV